MEYLGEKKIIKIPGKMHNKGEIYLRRCLRAKIDGDISNRFLIHFMEVTGLKK